MALYTIGDFHLSLSNTKPMDVFGTHWKDHASRIQENFAELTPEDTTVLCGDLCWGMTLEESLPEFHFVDALPGRKILLKGNHDYWWTTMKKMKTFLSDNGLDSIEILNNNSFLYTDPVSGFSYALCGTRGWFFEEETGSPHDRLILNREVGRLKASLDSADPSTVRDRLVFLHYPPLYANYRCEEILALLKEYGIRHCYYGHIHGRGTAAAFNGWADGTEFRLTSADFLNFKPEKITLY